MRKLNVSVLAALLPAAALAACASYNPDLGNVPYRCAPEGEAQLCPEGYRCETDRPPPNDRVCVSIEDGLQPDAGTVDGFQCADDSPLEGGTKNDTPQTAYQTPVDSQRQDLSLAGLAICPEGDVDFYAVTLSSVKGLEVIVSWDSGQPIQMSITNASGTALVNGVAMGDKALRACAPNLPMGTYFAKAFAAGTTRNNYRLSIKAVADCAL